MVNREVIKNIRRLKIDKSSNTVDIFNVDEEKVAEGQYWIRIDGNVDIVTSKDDTLIRFIDAGKNIVKCFIHSTPYGEILECKQSEVDIASQLDKLYDDIIDKGKAGCEGGDDEWCRASLYSITQKILDEVNEGHTFDEAIKRQRRLLGL